MSNLNLNDIAEKYFDFDKQSRLRKSTASYNFDSQIYESSKIATEHNRDLSLALLEEPSYQQVLRPYFGKLGANYQGIGTHPDFSHLEKTSNTELHYIVTMFIDIKGSTRLNLLLDLEDAFYVKNRVLQAAIDVVRSFDGHPHRLMGDALMAFFGGKNTTKECAITDAINACAMLRLALTETVFPQLDRYIKSKSNLAIRIGIDFGDDENILWGCYGFENVTEVTAQGLNVDCASKLQHQANSNHVMMGGNITKYIDFPEQFTSIKKKEIDGRIREEPYLKPNITDKDGAPINYEMFHLNHDKYIDLLPIPIKWKRTINGNNLIELSGVRYWCEVFENNKWSQYASVSRFLDPNLDLKFIVHITTDIVNRHGGLTIKFTKKNNGKEAGEDVKPVEYNQYLYQSRGGRNGPPTPISTVETTEKTIYRGLHTMTVEIISMSSGVTIYRNIIGVYIYGENKQTYLLT